MVFWQNSGLDRSYSYLRMNEQKIPTWGLPERGEKGNTWKQKTNIPLKVVTIRVRKETFQKTSAGRRHGSVAG